MIRCRARGVARQGGFSLVELMVASALGIALVTFSAQLLVDTSRLNRDLANTNDLVERGRFALQRLKQDARPAGHWGPLMPEFDDLGFESVPTDVPLALPDPCLEFALWPMEPGHRSALVKVPVQILDAANYGRCAGLLAAESRQPATDVLVVRHAAGCAAGTPGCAAQRSNALYFQVSNCTAEFTSGRDFVLDPNDWPLHERDCATAAARRTFNQYIYFIRRNARGVPSLYRSAFGTASDALRQRAPQEWVPGVERFRIGLGVDDQGRTGAPVDYSSVPAWRDSNVRRLALNRGDGVPDGAFRYCSERAPCGVEDFINSPALRFHLLVRASHESAGHIDGNSYQLGDTTVGPFHDRYKRRVVSATVWLPNIAGRRVMP